ncbi:MAG: DNA polymerase III subunit delta, partial [Gammaproteobacteria bacterium]|nr:DNA polymerase III subunit delta [Gammaproteobacteria bacterium]
MKLKIEQLSRHLSEYFLPVYLVSGDEPLLIQEASDQIRSVANQKGFSERELLYGDKGDCDTLLSASETMSLFAEQKIYEFRLA